MLIIMTCNICLNDFISDDPKIVETPCNHSFHLECIKTWLDTPATKCPLCRFSFTDLEKNLSEGRSFDCSSMINFSKTLGFAVQMFNIASKVNWETYSNFSRNGFVD